MERLTTIRNRFWNNEKGPVKDHNLVITFTIRADKSLVPQRDVQSNTFYSGWTGFCQLFEVKTDLFGALCTTPNRDNLPLIAPRVVRWNTRSTLA